MSDRVIIMHNGRVAGELTAGEATEEEVLMFATGENKPWKTSQRTKTAKQKDGAQAGIHNGGKTLFSKYSTLPVLIILFIIASAISPAFLTDKNIINVIRQMAANGIISIGMTFVVMTGGIDISVGSVVGFSSIMFAVSFQPSGLVAPYQVFAQGLNALIPDAPYLCVIVAIILVLILCAALGLVNGLGVCKGGLPPFIMTMGTLTLYRGIALLICEGKPLYMDADLADKIRWLGEGRIFNIPIPVYVLAGVTIVAWLVLERTVFRTLYPRDRRQPGKPPA